MSSNTAEVVFAGNAKGVLDEYHKMEKAHDSQTKKLLAGLKVSRSAANEEKKLRAEVAAAIEKCRTPAEAYIATMNRMKQALAQGKMSAEDFNRVRDKELQKLNAAKVATDKLTEAEKKAYTQRINASQASKSTESTTGSLITSYGILAGSIGAATVALRAHADEQQRIQDKSINTVMAVDKMAREYAVQAGVPEDQVDATRDRIIKIARDNSIPVDKAFAAAKQLSSVGAVDPDKSGALDNTLKIAAAANLKDGDQAQLISSMAQFLGAYKQPVNGETILGLGVRMVGLMAEQVEVSELGDFAKAIPIFAEAGVPQEEALAMMTGMRNKMPASEVGTGAKNILSILQAASEDKSNTEVLEKLGLKPTDVDVVGETATVALQRFSDALAKAPEEKQAAYLTQMFGRETAAKASIVLSGLADMPRFIEMQKDTKGFVERVERAGKGPAAVNQMQITDDQIVDLERGGIAAKRDMIKRHFESEYQRSRSDIENDPSLSVVGRNARLYGMSTLHGIGKAAGLFVNPEERISPETLEEITKKYQQAPFTEQDLRARMNGAAAAQAPAALDTAPIVNAINNQTGVLNSISNKLNPPSKPTVNPNLRGRPE